MAQFLRFAGLIIFAAVGFGSGICGLVGLGGSAVDALNGHSGGGGGENFTGLVVVMSIIGLVVAVGCFFATRALARSLRAHTTPMPELVPAAGPPPEPPSVPPSAPPPAA